MKFSSGYFAALALLVAIPVVAFAQEPKPSLRDFGWMGGCWEFSVAERQLHVTEQWMKPAGGMMIGAGRTVRAGKVVDFEVLRVVEEAEGIFYIAKPTGNKDETRFKLVKAGTGELVFENPAHDFPQRIIYRREGDKLNARIEGTSNGRTRGIDFPYTRSKCE